MDLHRGSVQVNNIHISPRQPEEEWTFRLQINSTIKVLHYASLCSHIMYQAWTLAVRLEFGYLRPPLLIIVGADRLSFYFYKHSWQWDHNIELFARSGFYFERYDRKPALRGAPSQVLSHLTSPAEQRSSALRRAWSHNNTRLWYRSCCFFSPVVNLKWFFFFVLLREKHWQHLELLFETQLVRS